MAECAGWCVQQQKQTTLKRHESFSLLEPQLVLLPSTNGTWFPMNLFPEKDRGKHGLNSHSKRAAPRLKKKRCQRKKGRRKKRRKEIGDKNHRASFSPPSSSLVIRSLHTFCYTCSADKWHTRQMKHIKQDRNIVTNVEARMTRWWIGTMAKEIHFRQSFYTDSILEDLILKCHAPSFSRVQNWWTINSPPCWQIIQTNLIKCWREGVKENQRKHINK